MKFRIVLLVLLAIAHFELCAQNKLALVVGIGDYPENNGWTKIHGDNDIPLITNMLETNGFDRNHIYVLKNAGATKQAITMNLEKLIQEAKAGDVIYIHFSGHGQQVTDIDGDENDNFDEAWIPYDACKKYLAGVYEGESHIIDDELFLYLTRLRNAVGKRGKIIVISDACHSGSGSRGDEDEDCVRGTNDKFEIPSKTWTVSRIKESEEWLFVAACKSYQVNFEFKDSKGNYYGMLSYVLSNKKNIFNDYSYLDVLNEVNENMYKISRYPQQIDVNGKPNETDNKMF